jgi:two-component system NtrC family response regulator
LPESEAKPRLLIVENDEAALRQLRWTFDSWEVHGVRERSAALAACREEAFPVVLLDLGLPPDPDGASEGLRALGELLAVCPDTKIIVVTGREERVNALRAVELGAFDYYKKPVDPDEIRLLVRRAFDLHQLQAENRRLARSGRESLPGVVCVSGAMHEVCRTVERAATSRISILLVGESGTGKEVIARAIHALSPRSNGPLVAVNCAAIPEGLLESELFGHERGAFTGADRRVLGRFETAHGGTLFLDEVGEVPAAAQVKLLRFLQDHVIQRIGGREDIPIDVRLVSATNRPVRSLAGGDGALREDLFYRLSELLVEVPPLRERPEDAVALAQHFLEKYGPERQRPIEGLASDAIAAIASHSWPGNVRELENRMKRAIVLAESPRIGARDLGIEGDEPLDTRDGTLRTAVSGAERDSLLRAWVQSGHNVSRAARLLGVSRPKLYKLLREHGLRGA